ncbi:MAG: hypothetical protein IJM73_03615 [Spirochaetales bacterium]|nr:hypothetical protein [Spirochaetales bacterium]
MIFTLGNFRLDVDTEKTEELYANAPVITETCSCEGCSNYVQAAKLFPPEVKVFFHLLGADPEKAAEVYLLYSDDKEKKAAYGGFYHLCGKILEGKTDGSERYTVSDGYRVHFTDDISLPEEGLNEPAIQMEIDFQEVPWVY